MIRNQKLFNIKVNECHVITPKDVIRGQKKFAKRSIKAMLKPVKALTSE